MLSYFKRRIYSVLNSQRTEIYGLRNPRRQLEATRSAHRRFTTFLASGSLRRRYAMPSHATLRHLHVRAISYSSIPRFVARAFRVPIAGATVGVGGFGYANYKFEGRLYSDFPLPTNSNTFHLRNAKSYWGLDQYGPRYCYRCI